MRLVGLLALPVVAVLASPALSQDLQPTDPAIDMFQTSSVDPGTDEGTVRVVKRVKVAKAANLRTVADAEVSVRSTKARYKPGMLLPAGMAF